MLLIFFSKEPHSQVLSVNFGTPLYAADSGSEAAHNEFCLLLAILRTSCVEGFSKV